MAGAPSIAMGKKTPMLSCTMFSSDTTQNTSEGESTPPRAQKTPKVTAHMSGWMTKKNAVLSARKTEALRTWRSSPARRLATSCAYCGSQACRANHSMS